MFHHRCFIAAASEPEQIGTSPCTATRGVTSSFCCRPTSAACRNSPGERRFVRKTYVLISPVTISNVRGGFCEDFISPGKPGQTDANTCVTQVSKESHERISRHNLGGEEPGRERGALLEPLYWRRALSALAGQSRREKRHLSDFWPLLTFAHDDCRPGQNDGQIRRMPPILTM